MASDAGLGCAYLIVGPDELKRDEALARLRRRVDGPLAAFNLEEVQASPELQPADVRASLDTLPVGADRRVVIVHGAEKLPKPVSEAIVSYLDDPNPSCTLALVAERLAKSTRLYKAVDATGPRSVIACAAASARDMPGRVVEMARQHGVRIDPVAAKELVARVGDSTLMLDRQLCDLAALLGGSGSIDVAFVEANVARLVEVKPWEFLDRLSSRDVHRSLALLRLLTGSPLGLLSLVVSRLRDLVCAQSLAARGQASALAATLKKKDWQVKSYVGWARGFREGELARLLADCAATERALKSGADPDSAMTALVVRVCTPER